MDLIEVLTVHGNELRLFMGQGILPTLTQATHLSNRYRLMSLVWRIVDQTRQQAGTLSFTLMIGLKEYTNSIL